MKYKNSIRKLCLKVCMKFVRNNKMHLYNYKIRERDNYC